MPTKDIVTGESIPAPASTRHTRYDSGHDALAGSRDPEMYNEAPTPKGYRVPEVTHYRVDALLERKGFYGVVDSVSPKCAEAWAVVEKCVEDAREALDRRDDLSAQEAQARRNAAQGAQAAIAAGKQVKVDLPDFAAQREAAEIACRAHYDAALAALHEYKAVFDSELAPSLERLVAEIAPARAEALAAWEAARGPLLRLHNVLQVADVVQRRVDPDDVTHEASPEALRLAAAAAGALGTVNAWLASADPYVSGSRWTAPDDVTPPRHVRSAWANSERHADVMRLAEVEHLQDNPPLSVTSYTRHLSHLFRRVD